MHYVEHTLSSKHIYMLENISGDVVPTWLFSYAYKINFVPWLLLIYPGAYVLGEES